MRFIGSHQIIKNVELADSIELDKGIKLDKGSEHNNVHANAFSNNAFNNSALSNSTLNNSALNNKSAQSSLARSNIAKHISPSPRSTYAVTLEDIHALLLLLTGLVLLLLSSFS